MGVAAGGSLQKVQPLLPLLLIRRDEAVGERLGRQQLFSGGLLDVIAKVCI